MGRIGDIGLPGCPSLERQAEATGDVLRVVAPATQLAVVIEIGRAAVVPLDGKPGADERAVAANARAVDGEDIARDSALIGAGFAVQWNDRCSTYFYYDG